MQFSNIYAATTLSSIAFPVLWNNNTVFTGVDYLYSTYTCHCTE